MDLSLSPWQLTIIFVGVGIGAVAKGATGVGLPLVGVPVIASFLGVERAVVLMALPTFITNCWLLWEHRRSRSEARELPAMLLLGVIGAVAGTLLLRATANRWLALVLGLLIIAYLALRLARPTLRFSPHVTRMMSPVVGFAGGLLQGSTGVSGPLIASYFHGFGLRHSVFVFSVTAMFQLYALVQMATFAQVGLYTMPRLIESVLALLPSLALLPLGIRLARRLPSHHLDRAVLVLLASMALKLLYDSVS